MYAYAMAAVENKILISASFDPSPSLSFFLLGGFVLFQSSCRHELTIDGRPLGHMGGGIIERQQLRLPWVNF